MSAQVSNAIASWTEAVTLLVHNLFLQIKTSPELAELAVMTHVRPPLSQRNAEGFLHKSATLMTIIDLDDVVQR